MMTVYRDDGRGHTLCTITASVERAPKDELVVTDGQRSAWSAGRSVGDAASGALSRTAYGWTGVWWSHRSWRWTCSERQSLRSRTRLIRWSASLRSTSEARGRVGRMFRTRFGSLVFCHSRVASAVASSSVSAA